MKKILLLFLSLVLISGCGFSKQMTAKETVKEYLESYRSHDDDVMDALNDYVDNEEDLTDKQKEKYKEVLKKQYKNIKYKITNETYNGNEATVTADITVFDLYGAQKESDAYLAKNNDEFLDDDGKYDKGMFLDYKLDKMNEYIKEVTYTIDFHLIKDEKDNWEIRDLSKDDLEKIHGIYEYES